VTATNPTFPDEPEPWQEMGILVHELLQEHPSLKGRDHGICFMPLADSCYVVTEDRGREVRYEITSPRWHVPYGERSARILVDQLVTGLRDAVKEARRGSGTPAR
jgi:hypothetical protein